MGLAGFIQVLESKSQTFKYLESPGKSWKVTWRVLENRWLWVEMQMYSNEKRSDTLRKQ